MSPHAGVDAVLDFWFGPDWEQLPPHQVAERQKKLWWSKNPDIDAECRTRFAPLVQQAAANQLDDWTESPRSMLALILLLDQMPRNIYRDTAQAFAHDELARHCSHLALAMGLDADLPPLARVFLYLPLEHAEDLDDQEYVVQLMGALAKAASAEDKATFDGYADYARRHHAVIARFGRFPHRNRILARESTPEEVDFLKQPGSSF